jgi:hypothetical protein
MSKLLAFSFSAVCAAAGYYTCFFTHCRGTGETSKAKLEPGMVFWIGNVIRLEGTDSLYSGFWVNGPQGEEIYIDRRTELGPRMVLSQGAAVRLVLFPENNKSFDPNSDLNSLTAKLFYAITAFDSHANKSLTSEQKNTYYAVTIESAIKK